MRNVQGLEFPKSRKFESNPKNPSVLSSWHRTSPMVLSVIRQHLHALTYIFLHRHVWTSFLWAWASNIIFFLAFAAWRLVVVYVGSKQKFYSILRENILRLHWQQAYIRMVSYIQETVSVHTFVSLSGIALYLLFHQFQRSTFHNRLFRRILQRNGALEPIVTERRALHRTYSATSDFIGTLVYIALSNVLLRHLRPDVNTIIGLPGKTEALPWTNDRMAWAAVTVFADSFLQGWDARRYYFELRGWSLVEGLSFCLRKPLDCVTFGLPYALLHVLVFPYPFWASLLFMGAHPCAAAALWAVAYEKKRARRVVTASARATRGRPRRNTRKRALSSSSRSTPLRTRVQS